MAAAQENFLQKDTLTGGEIRFMRLNPRAMPVPLTSSRTFLRTALRMSYDDELRLISTRKDNIGYDLEFYEQYYNGVPVEYGAYSVHAKNGIVETIFGNYRKIDVVTGLGQSTEKSGLQTIPVLTEKQALNKAIEFIGAKKFQWEDANAESALRDMKNDPTASFYPKGRLLITEDTKARRFRLAFKFPIRALEPASKNFVYVDAITGEIIRKDPIALCSNQAGTAQKRYSGSQAITTDLFRGSYRLREGGGKNIVTKSGNTFQTAVEITDNDNNWTAAEHNANGEDVGLDVHWGLEKTYDYFLSVHGRNSFDGTGGALFGFVHAGSTDNAHWDADLRAAFFEDGTTHFGPVI